MARIDLVLSFALGFCINDVVVRAGHPEISGNIVVSVVSATLLSVFFAYRYMSQNELKR